MNKNNAIGEGNSTATSAGSRSRRMAANALLCLMLTFAMVLPMAVPAEVFATGSKTTLAAGSSYTFAKKQYMAGIYAIFRGSYISNTHLGEGPTVLRATGKWSSVKLAWTGVSDPSSIKGYIILRKDRTGNNWRQIGTVKSPQTTYVDDTVSENNLLYYYSVVAYKRVHGKVMVSGPAGWAGACTSRSTKNNVNKVKVTNPANVSSIMIGSCAQTYLSFPKKPLSKYIRWWSSNDNIATVDAKGLITGKRRGTARIYMKTHTGRISSFKVRITKPGTAQAMIDTFKAWEGYSRINGKQKSIIDIYNSVTPWPVGYKMKYSDAWCDATITAAAIKTGNAGRIGRECSVPRHISIFQKLGIWEEDGTIKPRPGDIIVYSWSRFKQPNNASASHIGLVIEVNGKEITALEGNRGIGIVATRTIPVGWGCIRGYARPKYKK